MRYRLLPLAVAAIAACSGDDAGSSSSGENGGTLVIALPAEPEKLNPAAIGMIQEKQIVDQVFDVLAEIGPSRNTLGDRDYAPRLAHAWSWSADSLSIAFSLNPDARWHDGQPVTSRDVRFSLELYKDPQARSMFLSRLADIDSITTPDSLTAVAWYARQSPEMFYTLVYNLLVLPEHLLRDADRTALDKGEFARNPVGSGPFRFRSWSAGQAIEVTANETYHLGRPRLNRVIWRITPDLTAALTLVLTGEADLLESLTRDALAQVTSSEQLQTVAYPSLTYTYLGFNTRDARDPSKPHPLFNSIHLRRAIAMSVDRSAMMANVFDSLAHLAYGPFTQLLPTADTTIPQPPFDVAAADRLLDSLGWARGDGGVRTRAGQPLRFRLTYPVSSIQRGRYAELIQAQLRERGVQVDIESPDVRVMGPQMATGSFDAVLNSFTVEPSPSSLRGSWYSTPPTSRGRNFLAYANPAFDALVDSASGAMTADAQRDFYRRAYRTLVADLPAVWLYETRTIIALHKRFRTVGHDAEYWWRHLRNWYIPPNERITRDG